MNDRPNERIKRASNIATVCLYVLWPVICIVVAVAVVISIAYSRKTLIRHIQLSLFVACFAYDASEHVSDGLCEHAAFAAVTAAAAAADA